MRSRVQINDTSKRNKRGPYKARARSVDNRNILTASEREKEVDGELYIVLDSGNYLLKIWVDIFQWFQGGKVPDDWLD